MLAQAISRAMHDLLLPPVLKLLVYCLLAYLVFGIILAWLIGAGLAAFSGLTGAEGAWVQALGTIGGGVGAWFLFPLLYPILMGFFDETLAEAIEREDYAALPKATPPFWPTLAQDAWFSVKALLLNFVLLPFYLIPVLGWMFFYILNGWLLGTQFFRMSAGRRSSRAETETLIRQMRGKIIGAGIVIMFMATVPLLNLAAPILGVATLLHLYHLAKGNDRAEVLMPRSAA